MNILYSTPATPEHELCYVDRLTFDQHVAHLEFLGTLVFFAAKKAYKGMARVHWDWLADRVDFQSINAVEAVPLSMSFLSKLGNFSKQKYRSIRENLEAMGFFTVQKAASRQGRRQQITSLLDVNLRKIVELIRDICDRIHQIIESPEEHRLWPDHGFAFLIRWHTKVFGYHPGDRDHSKEVKVLTLGDREQAWKRTLHHEQFDAFVRHVEREALQTLGWGQEVIDNVRSRLAYPEDLDQVMWAKLCPDIARLSSAEVQFLAMADWFIFRGKLDDSGAQVKVSVELAIEYGKDSNNGANKGRPIALAHPQAWAAIGDGLF